MREIIGNRVPVSPEGATISVSNILPKDFTPVNEGPVPFKEIVKMVSLKLELGVDFSPVFFDRLPQERKIQGTREVAIIVTRAVTEERSQGVLSRRIRRGGRSRRIKEASNCSRTCLDCLRRMPHRTV